MLISIFPLSLLTIGCQTSELLNPPLPEAVTRYGASPYLTPILLDVKISESVGSRLGTQFFLIVPFGSTGAGELEQLSFNSSYKVMVASGFAPKLERMDPLSIRNGAIPTLTIEINDVSISTYDLIATRLVSTSVELTLHWTGSSGELRSTSVASKQRNYIRLPFSEELSREYRLALEDGLREGLSRLRIRP
ncbi:MAG: hypothetical protein KDD70_13550 [Bdellovibrionales bacterium]|nr:hypothetical protein [Bdellovibrionales bacterium]